VTLAAAIFLFVFGSLGTWVITLRYPQAHYTRAGYIFMAIGGLAFIVWAFSHSLGVAIGAMVLLFAGGTLGVIGAFRKEVRLLPPT
jgi:hypothetical protein